MTPARYVSFGVLLALLIVLGATFYQFVAPFLMPLFLAAVLALICQPFFRTVLAKCGGRTSLAAGVTTITLVAVVMLPILIGTVIAANQLVEFAHTYLSEHTLETSGMWDRVISPALRPIADVIPGYDEERLKEELSANADQLARKLAATTLSLASSTVGAFVSLSVATGMFLVALYYFLADGPVLLRATQKLVPVSAAHQQKLWNEFTKVTRAVVVATFFAAFAQGLATALALQVLGFGHFLVFLLVATVFSLVPIAGAWLVWAPCAAWLAIQGHWFSAIGLALWGTIVVGFLDNVVRTYVLNSDAELHPLLAFISVIGALQVLGLWGIFVGPIIASCLTALVQILHEELNEVLATTPAPTASPPIPPVPDATIAGAPAVAVPAGNGQGAAATPAVPG